MRWMLVLAMMSGCAWTNRNTYEAEQRRQAAARPVLEEQARRRAAIHAACDAALANPAAEATRAACINYYAAEATPPRPATRPASSDNEAAAAIGAGLQEAGRQLQQRDLHCTPDTISARPGSMTCR